MCVRNEYMHGNNTNNICHSTKSPKFLVIVVFQKPLLSHELDVQWKQKITLLAQNNRYLHYLLRGIEAPASRCPLSNAQQGMVGGNNFKKKKVLKGFIHSFICCVF
uniref:Uncharacterized protein n=1 Tax=Cacopsylla melanoneura TaxID=428564 RepID=A0A8D8RB39_9HEMI